jgi:hypothetical protein
VRLLDEWGQCNTTETAWRAADACTKARVSVLHYDCGGVGAGVRGTYASTQRPLSFLVNPVQAGGSPSETRWPDGKTSKERFKNLRAEMWWLMRARFERTFEFVEKGVRHPLEDLISIPNHPQLIAQLSHPLYHHSDTGKILIESKDDMRKRGVASPDFADALALCFCPLVPRRTFSAATAGVRPDYSAYVPR